MGKMITKKELISKLNSIEEEFKKLDEKFNDIIELDVNFDKLIDIKNECKKLKESLSIEFDNKLIENNKNTDLRLNGYHTRMDGLFDDFIEKSNKLLNERTAEINDFIKTETDKIDNALKNNSDQVDNYKKQIADLEKNSNETINDFVHKKELDIQSNFEENKNTISETIKDSKEQISKYYDEIKAKINELNEQNESFRNDESKKMLDQRNEYTDKLSTLINDFNNNLEEISKRYEKEWNEKVQSIREELNKALNSHELNLNNMIDSSVNKEINKMVVDEIVNESYEKLLFNFNKTLVGIGEKERNEITEAIKSLYLSKNEEVINRIEEKQPINPLKDDELKHKSYDKLMLCIKSDVIPMLVGPAGTGKSYAAEQLSRELKLRFYMANRIQNTFELVGFQNAAGHYMPTQFYEAYTKGGLFLFDEVDASSPEALVTINAAIAQKHMAFPGHKKNVEMHKDFKVICAGNTYGTGSTIEYTGRNKLDAATLDRFMVIEWDYDKEMESKIISNRELLEFCWELRRASASINKEIIVSTRGIETLDRLLKELESSPSNIYSYRDLFECKFFKKARKDDVNRIIENISTTMSNNKYYKLFVEGK